MRAILYPVGALAVIGAVVYFAFVNPSWAIDVDESYSWTTNCVDKSDSLSVDREQTSRFEQGLGFGRVVVIRRGPDTAAIFMTSSERQAADAEQQLRDTILEGARQAGISVSAEQIRQRIFRKSRQVFAYGNSANSAPSPAFMSDLGQCVYEIYDNRWQAIVGLETKQIGRPFLRSS